MIAAIILISFALMATDSKPDTTAQPATPAAPTAPGTGLVPKALLSGGDAPGQVAAGVGGVRRRLFRRILRHGGAVPVLCTATCANDRRDAHCWLGHHGAVAFQYFHFVSSGVSRCQDQR